MSWQRQERFRQKDPTCCQLQKPMMVRQQLRVSFATHQVEDLLTQSSQPHNQIFKLMRSKPHNQIEDVTIRIHSAGHLCSVDSCNTQGCYPVLILTIHSLSNSQTNMCICQCVKFTLLYMLIALFRELSSVLLLCSTSMQTAETSPHSIYDDTLPGSSTHIKQTRSCLHACLHTWPSAKLRCA